jgi:undecaprenyl-diphosphatase
VLALVPGTSRSGATILGAILLGMSRTAGAEFSFFLAIPTMLGASALKVLKFLLEGSTMSGSEWACLIVASLVAFFVSLLAIRSLMDYVKKHSFSAFGVYRILLGALVLLVYLISRA